jgi:hypothetical protein
MTRGSGGGGGYGSRPHVEKPVKTGTGSRSTRPAGVAMFGQMQGSHVTRGEESTYRGEPLHNNRSFQPVKFGNEVALNVGKGGPGAGRDTHPCGGQGTWGNVAPGNPPPVPDRHIIESYGPDYNRPGNPHRRSPDQDADF